MSRAGKAAALAALAAFSGAALALGRSTGWLASFGARASGARLDRMRRSSRWAQGRFHNPMQTATLLRGSAGRMLHMQLSERQPRYPRRPIAVVQRRRADFDSPPASGLRVTWIGHATVLLEIGGARVLTDPVWSERVSPSTLVGPSRFFEPPIALSDLPPIDVVLLSHDHYDHLDRATIQALAPGGATFVAPLGVGAHLERWGVPASRIRELDWGERTELAGVTFAATPARHFSGRGFWDRDATLWCSWVVASGPHRVFYSGDSGYFDGFREIGREHGPFDLTLMSLGAYAPTWPLIHMTPEELVQAHVDLKGELLVPVHWATFNLAFHGWNEPAIRMAAAARRVGARFSVPRPGQQVEPAGLRVDADEEEWWTE